MLRGRSWMDALQLMTLDWEKWHQRKKSYIGSAMRKRGVLGDSDREKLVGIFPKDKKSNL